MKRIFLVLIFITILCPYSIVMGQKYTIRNEFYDAEFFLAKEAYRDALQAYTRMYNADNQDNANINYRLGICYLNLPGEKTKSISYLEKAITDLTGKYREGKFRESKAPYDAWLYLGNAYRINYQLDAAINAYNKYLELNLKKRTINIAFARQQISACERAKTAILGSKVIMKENMGKKLDADQDIFNAIISGNGDNMAYMGSQKFYDAVFFVNKTDGKWGESLNITSQLESDGDQYISSLSWDGTRMYLVKVSSFNGDIMESEFLSGRWIRSKVLDKTINSKYFESHASTTPDGNTMYFTSNRKGSIGGMDIYTSVKDQYGKWGEPVNLGVQINTEFNEETPFICEDGKTLFFSSQGHESIGGFDIFYTVKQDDGSWSKPVPLPYPVNTTDDDLFFFPVNNGKSGYLTSYSEDGLRNIWFITLFPDAEAEVSDLSETEPQDATEEKSVITPESVTKTIAGSVKPESTASEETTEELVIEPIFFNFDSYELTSESITKLDQTIMALRKYPDLVLEVRGHTDSTGPAGYNLQLSERRAQEVKKYMVSKGIDSNRIKPVGLGIKEQLPATLHPDGTVRKEFDYYNRRVEYRILSGTKDKIILKPVKLPN